MPVPLQLIKSRPVWQLPSSSPHDIYLELMLNASNLPYTTTVSAYPYSTATGLTQALPCLIQAHRAFDCKHAVEYIKENICNLDELRSDAEHAIIRCHSIALDRLIEFVYALSVVERARFVEFDREYAHEVSLGVRELIRLKRQREIQQYIELNIHSIDQSAEIQSEIRAILDSFNELVENSTFPFIFAAQPSTLDCKLAAVVAWLSRMPIKEPKAKAYVSRPIDLSTNESIHESMHRSTSPTPAEPETPSILPFSDLLVKSFPSLIAHSEHMFNTFFSQYAASFESESSLLDQARQRVTSKLRMVGSRQSSGSNNLTLSPSPQAIISQYNLEADISRLVKERRAKWNEPVPTMKELDLAALPTRLGDDWLDAVPLTDAEKAEQFKRRTRTFTIFAVVAAAAFAIYRRNQAGSN